MTVEREQLHASARKASAVFTLPLSFRRWRGLAGNQTGAGTGDSSDFEDHRLWQHGDDLRHLDWAAYARTDQPMMKVFRAETRPSIDLIIDASASMSVTPAKRKRTLELCLFCAECAARSGASLRCLLLREKQISFLEPKGIPDIEFSSLVHPSAFSALPRRPEAMPVIVSDTLWQAPPDSVIKRVLRDSGSAVWFAPWVREESSPEWSGAVEFHDTESGIISKRNISPGTLAKYKNAYRRHFALWKEFALRAGVRFARVASEPELAQSLGADAFSSDAVEPCR